MNEAQTGLYLREWGKVRRILRAKMTPKEADAQRHAIHIQALGADKSSGDFTNKDFDEVLKRFRAISQPANYPTQIALEQMPGERKRWSIRHLLAALQEDEDEVERIIFRRQQAGRLAAGKSSVVTFESLGESDLEKIMLDLKAACRARWPKKGDLLTEIRIVQMSADLDEERTREAVLKALNLRGGKVPALADLIYEKLLIVLSVMRAMEAGKPVRAGSSIDIPF